MNKFWYKFMGFGGITIKDGVPIILTAVAINFVWLFVITILLIK